MRRPRVTRCGRTSSIRRAAASHAQPLRPSSAPRLRQQRPGLRGGTSWTHHASRPCCRHPWASMGALTPPGGVPVSGCLRAPAARTPAGRHVPLRLRRPPARPLGCRHARRWRQAQLSTPPRPGASTRPVRGPVRHGARRSGRACWGLWPCLKPWEKACTAGAKMASRRLTTARWPLWAATPGVPLDRCFPASCASPTRSTGGAPYRWSRSRSCRARRGAARGSAYGGAVPGSRPGALGWRLSRAASRRQAWSLPCNPLVHPSAGSRGAGGARLWSGRETVGEPGGAPRGRARPTCCPAWPARPGVRCVAVAPLPRDSAPLRLPPAPLGSLGVSRAARYRACVPAGVGASWGAWPGGSAQGPPGPVGTRAPTPGVVPGDRWGSHVPALPRCSPAPLSDPGGVRRTCQSAPSRDRTAARTTLGGACPALALSIGKVGA